MPFQTKSEVNKASLCIVEDAARTNHSAVLPVNKWENKVTGVTYLKK